MSDILDYGDYRYRIHTYNYKNISDRSFKNDCEALNVSYLLETSKVYSNI